jgi:hypothetical protein
VFSKKFCNILIRPAYVLKCKNIHTDKQFKKTHRFKPKTYFIHWIKKYIKKQNKAKTAHRTVIYIDKNVIYSTDYLVIYTYIENMNFGSENVPCLDFAMSRYRHK